MSKPHEPRRLHTTDRCAETATEHGFSV
jgi:hypothetical protein